MTNVWAEAVTVKQPNTVAKFPAPTYVDPAFMYADFDELFAAVLASLTAY